jgi:hypothetical protein
MSSCLDFCEKIWTFLASWNRKYRIIDTFINKVLFRKANYKIEKKDYLTVNLKLYYYLTWRQ